MKLIVRKVYIGNSLDLLKKSLDLKNSISNKTNNPKPKLVSKKLSKVKELEEQIKKMKNCAFDLQISQNPCCNCKSRKEWKLNERL